MKSTFYVFAVRKTEINAHLSGKQITSKLNAATLLCKHQVQVNQGRFFSMVKLDATLGKKMEKGRVCYLMQCVCNY